MFFGHYDLEKMVPEDHDLRRIQELLCVEGIGNQREELKERMGREGFGVETGVRALFLQYYGDFSDREMEEQLRYNIVYRWFCGLEINTRTPDHSFFGRMRKRIGEEETAKLFHTIVDGARDRRLVRKIESFVDASAIRRKEALWEEKDKAREKEEKIDNRKVSKYSADKEARWGCKREGKYWFGYKRHVSVDTGSGLIEEVAVTRANMSDDDGFQLVCPRGKRVLADKGYDSFKVRGVMKRRKCEDGVLRKKIRKDYDEQRNKYLSKRRAPWEHVFSKMSRRTRYKGREKTSMQAIWEAIVHNMKRLIVLEREPIPIFGLA